MNARAAAQQEVWKRFVDSFGHGEAIVMAVQDSRLLDPDGLARLTRVGERIEAIDGVRSVLSLIGAVELVPGEFGATEVPVVPRGDPTERAALERVLDRNPQWTGLLVSSLTTSCPAWRRRSAASASASRLSTWIPKCTCPAPPRAVIEKLTRGSSTIHLA